MLIFYTAWRKNYLQDKVIFRTMAHLYMRNHPLVWSITMYAVIKTGGKQYKVQKDETLKVEKLDVDLGEKIEFDQVLMVANNDDVKVGSPYVNGSKVVAEVLGHGRGKKIMVLKFRRRKQYLKRQGHRQDFTEIKITDINA